MSAELIGALRRKCDADERLRLLQAQWEYDQRLVAQALQAIGITFPHYSLHDATHSNTILVQITRVLGDDRIEKLSATDIWLLLEAAYLHDVGMIVDDTTLRQWWRDESFAKHLESLRVGDDPVLAAAARLLEFDKIVKFQGTSWPLNVRRAVTLVVADFARKQHSLRSGRLVNDPMMIGLQSPRTMLIPDRLIKWLSEIVMAHGRSQQEVLALPPSESGLGTDMCHPRFIAFMLRLGDLLDLDNGRFCPVLASTFGSFPPSSLSHVGKHASIKHFHVCPARVEVEAVCREEVDTSNDPYGAYEAVANWLDWLGQEVQFLASRWADIAPSDFGGAPSLGDIKAHLEGYRFLEEGKRPRFRVDEPAFLNLVRGNNLYKERHDWLRELVANAEDATRIRVFLESGDEIKPLPSETPVEDPFEDVRALLAKYPVRIRIEKSKSAENRWTVVIEDEGTGISLSDLRYILTIGSSQKNPERLRLIRRMPPHLEPTGSFGIGLQSAFMVTDELSIASMHFRTRDRIHVLIRRPPLQEPQIPDGFTVAEEPPAGVYVRDLAEQELPNRPGTRITFEFEPQSSDDVTPTANEEPLGPDNVLPGPSPREESLSAEEAMPEATDFAFSFDPILAESGELEIEQLRAAAHELAENMLITIILDGEMLPSGSGSPVGEVRLHDPQSHCTMKYVTTNLKDNPVTLSYRGAEVREHRLQPLGLIELVFVIEFGRASDILTASRDTPTPEGSVVVREKLWATLERTFPHYLNRLSDEVRTSAQAWESTRRKENLSRASLFAKMYLPSRAIESGESWRDVPLLSDDAGGDVSASEVEQAENFGLLVSTSHSRPLAGRRDDSVAWYRMRSSSTSSAPHEAPRWIRDALLRLQPYAEYEGTFKNEQRYRFHVQDPRRSATEDAARQVLEDLKEKENYRPYRPVFPSPNHELYSHLSFKVLELSSWKPRHDWIVSQVVVSPLEFASIDLGATPAATIRHLEQYIHWVSKRKRIGDEAGLRTIREQTQRFIEFIVRTYEPTQPLSVFDQRVAFPLAVFDVRDSARLLDVPFST